MLIKDPPVAVTPHLLMLGTNEYPLYLYKGEREGTIFEGGGDYMMSPFPPWIIRLVVHITAPAPSSTQAGFARGDWRESCCRGGSNRVSRPS